MIREIAGHFPCGDAATKLIWLALSNITAGWGRAANSWKEAINQFAILHEDLFTKVAVQDLAPTCPPRLAVCADNNKGRSIGFVRAEAILVPEASRSDVQATSVKRDLGLRDFLQTICGWNSSSVGKFLQ